MGQHYEPIPPEPTGQRWSEVLGLFLGVQDSVLRYFHPNGDLVPTMEETTAAAMAQAKRIQAQAQAQVEQAQTRAKQAEERAAQLAEQLRATGIEAEG